MAKQIVKEVSAVAPELLTTESVMCLPFIGPLVQMRSGHDALYVLNDASCLLSIALGVMDVLPNEELGEETRTSLRDAVEFLTGSAKAIIDALPHQLPKDFAGAQA